MTLGPLAPSAAADFYVVPVEVTLNDQTETGEVYVSKDGKTLLRGEIFDMHADPFADNARQDSFGRQPVERPRGCEVTLVEFADFECPHCRELYEEPEGDRNEISAGADSSTRISR